MEQTLTPAGLLPLLISLLPLAIVAVALAWKGRAWSTREVPGAAFRLGIGALFAACVVPAWGLLAAQAAAWWWVRGWVIRSGGLLWPTAAAVMYVGWQAPKEALDAGIVIALAVGVFQSVLAVSQWREYPILNLPGQPKAIAETLEGLKNADGSQKAAWQVMLGRIKAIPDDEEASTPRAEVERACRRTAAWLERSVAAWRVT